MKYFTNVTTIDELFAALKAQHNKTADEYHQTTETAEEFRDIIIALLKLDGLDIELCGPCHNRR